MDPLFERRKAIALLVLFAIFVVSSFLAYREVTYFLLGNSTLGTVTRAYLVERRGRWGRSRGQVRRVEYHFTDKSGNTRTGTDEVDLSFPVSDSGDVGIRYMPGQDGRSRLDGHVHWLRLILLAVSGGIMLGGVIWIWRKARAAVHGSSSTGRKPHR